MGADAKLNRLFTAVWAISLGAAAAIVEPSAVISLGPQVQLSLSLASPTPPAPSRRRQLQAIRMKDIDFARMECNLGTFFALACRVVQYTGARASGGGCRVSRGGF
ncbi:hypothetical protein T492DRAFT_228172 [Pavlovales sp. CCMP2436]|nr:hypothetical protein T492DRAFT_228172 [Pavlovales sp. CCMP2436]